MFTRFTLVSILILIQMSCHSGKTSVDSANIVMSRDIVFAPGPQAIVYKTKKDYSNLVAVTMNAQRTEIVSYPSPGDVYYKGVLAKPMALKNTYWLDNRGIDENSVFLSYTYEEYSALKEAPALKEMMLRIVDKNPFTEIINCGIRSQYKNEEEELNKLIDSNFLGCKTILKRQNIDLIIEAPKE